MTTSEILPGAENEPLDATASQLAYLVESFLDLGVLVHDNQGTPQLHSALTRKTNQVVSQLSGLTNSPFTQQKSNARLKGKMLAFRKLLQVLGGKLVEEFPHLKDAVENIESRTIKLEAASGV